MIDQLNVETAVLSAMAIGKRWADDVRSVVSKDMFVGISNRAIFGRICWCYDADVKPTKFALLGAGEPDVFGDGGPKVVTPEQVDAMLSYLPSGENASYYAGILRDLNALRLCRELSKPEPSTPVAIAEVLSQIRGASAYERGILPTVSTMEDYETPAATLGVPSGFAMIDANTTTGGWPCGQTSIVCAYTGGGKSVFMWQSALSLADKGFKVVYATFADLSKVELGQRAVQLRSGWGKKPNEFGAQLDYDEAIEWVRSMKSLYVYDATLANTSVTVEAFISRMENARSKPDIFFIDYAQELTTQEKGASRYDQSNLIAGKLRKFAMDMGKPVVIGSQVTLGENGKPDVTKDSRTWEERAGLVVKIAIQDEAQRAKLPDEEYRGVEGITVANLSKNRFGKKMRCYWVFNSKHIKFEEL